MASKKKLSKPKGGGRTARLNREQNRFERTMDREIGKLRTNFKSRKRRK